MANLRFAGIVLAAAAGLGCAAAPAPAGGLVWLAGSGQVRALHLPALAAAGQWPLPGPVVDSALDPMTGRLDLLLGGSSPAVLALASPRGVTRHLGFDPAAMAVDVPRRRILVAGVGADGKGRLWSLDANSLAPDNMLAVAGEPSGLAVSPAGDQLLVASTHPSMLELIQLTGAQAAVSIPLAQPPRQLVSLPFGHTAFVLCGDTVAVVDTRGGVLLCYLPVGPGAQQMLLKPDGGELYVSNASGTVSAINTGTFEVADTMAAGVGAASMAVAADGSILYVANAEAGTISVISLDNRTTIARVEVGEHPASLGLSPDGLLLLVADTASSDLAVVRSHQDRLNPDTLLALLPSPPQPLLVRALPPTLGATP